ncbi:hypothetical protein [Mesorhizobium sangaii]|uniref:Uncharacterized protein n=1 Tax=Mesorhizobium sangaii TaxID=505389 RepID=A0A841PE19_9HYPH|nr:hypothetical protein [Mesorhizobium sangaii]MBB6411813.1 hypothetical protein [Mesorhizobium sangaii]
MTNILIFESARAQSCLQVNAKSLFDNRQTICSAGYCYRDEGRSLFASLRHRF